MPTSESARADRFAAYVDRLTEVLGHRDRHEPLRAYVTGLCLPGERKSVEPMAARVDPRHVRSRHQSMHHFVADAPWDATAMLRVARDWVLEAMVRHGPVAAWIVDDTAFPKKGAHSVGVARQYCGVLGKQDTCQVAVSVSVANDVVSLPVAYQLYLPESWAGDRRRRRAAGVPDSIRFQPKWQLALEQIRRVQGEGVPPAPVVADAGYGDTTAFREALTAAGLGYVVGVKKETTAWPPGQAPRPPKRWSGRGRPPMCVRRTATHMPRNLQQLAEALPPTAWRTVRWREGTQGAMRSRFARIRVRPAHRDDHRPMPRPAEWLLIEWPRGAAEPTKYWLATLAPTLALADLVCLAKLRWRIERDYQELKDELGLDHFEGRGWRGFHHHGALCIAAYAFLATERARLSPPMPLAFLRPARLPKGFKPRGTPSAA
jgi:SRSO17 transposase